VVHSLLYYIADGKSSVSKSSPKKIPIADDEPSIRFLLRKMLESETIEVLEAETGREALATARHQSRPRSSWMS
jgi:CheY-like chemotaxis protein